jgi:hypothetical protein
VDGLRGEVRGEGIFGGATGASTDAAHAHGHLQLLDLLRNVRLCPCPQRQELVVLVVVVGDDIG